MADRRMIFAAAQLLLVAVLIAGSDWIASAGAAEADRFEVWALDRADTVAGKGGGLLYIWTSDAIAAGPATAKPTVFDLAAAGKFPEPLKIELPREDTHSAAFCVDEAGAEHMLTVMRVSNEVNVVALKNGRVVETRSIARAFSPDPKPDVGELRGNRLFVMLRGANPLTAINDLKNPACTSGVAVFTVSKSCCSVS